MLHGAISRVGWNAVSGWAFDTDAPEVPVDLIVTVDGDLVARVLANRYRRDLERDGRSGRQSFELRFGAGLAPDRRHVIEVRREQDGAPVGKSPFVLEPAARLDGDLRAHLAKLIAAETDPAEMESLADFLAGQVDILLQARADRLGRHEDRVARQHFRLRWSDTSPPLMRRALLLDERLPWEGDPLGATILGQATGLQAQGYDVAMVGVDLRLGEPAKALAARDITVYGAPFIGSIEEVLRRESGAFALILFSNAHLAARYGPLGHRWQPSAQLAVMGAGAPAVG